jgi:hypothetical protein
LSEKSLLREQLQFAHQIKFGQATVFIWDNNRLVMQSFVFFLSLPIGCKTGIDYKKAINSIANT